MLFTGQPGHDQPSLHLKVSLWLITFFFHFHFSGSSMSQAFVWTSGIFSRALQLFCQSIVLLPTFLLFAPLGWNPIRENQNWALTWSKNKKWQNQTILTRSWATTTSWMKVRAFEVGAIYCSCTSFPSSCFLCMNFFSFYMSRSTPLAICRHMTSLKLIPLPQNSSMFFGWKTFCSRKGGTHEDEWK